MSEGLPIFQPSDDDITKLLMAKVHLGSKNCNHQMSKYVYKRRKDGVHVINVHKTWEKLLLAARIIANITDAKDVCAISSPLFGQRAILKFSKFVGSTPIAGRFTPGTFTNQIQKAFREPRVLIVTDPRVDHQPIRESSYVNIPIIAFCDTDTPLRYVDVAIPCNNKSEHSVGLLWWMLAREVARLRGNLPRESAWEVMPDLFFYRKPEEIEEEEAAAEQALIAAAEGPTSLQWEGAAADAGVMSADAGAVGAEWVASADVAAPVVQPIGTSSFTEAAPVGGEEWGNAAAEQEWGASANWQ